MGLLDVPIPVFHAEVFNWAGKDLGNPLRGRSLYPATLAAYDPNKDETVSIERRSRLMLMNQFKAKKFAMLSALDKLIALLRGFVAIIREQEHHDELSLQSVRNIINIVGSKALSSIHKVLLETLAKLLKICKVANDHTEATATQDHHEYASKRGQIPTQQQQIAPKSNPLKSSTPETSNRVSRIGFKAQKLPSISIGIPTTLKTGMALLGDVKPQAGQMEAEKLHSQSALTWRRGADTERVMNWLCRTTTLDAGENQEVREILRSTVEEHHEAREKQEQSQKSKQPTPVEEATWPNPITFTTSGVESIFDVQRVIIAMKNVRRLRSRVDNAANMDEKITGRCRISTAIASLEVSFCCTIKQLRRQLDVCDAVRLAVWGDERLENNPSVQLEDSSSYSIGNDPDPKASSRGE